MLDISFDKLVSLIVEKSGKRKAEIVNLIEKKKIELNGLVSDEGAAYIIANELGVKFLPDRADELLKIESIVPGIKRVNTVGRVFKVFSVASFKKGEKEGKVGSFLFGDETGVIRVVLWNDLTRLLSDDRICVGDVVRVSGGYSRKSRDSVELHLASYSRLVVNPENIPSLPDVSVFISRSMPEGGDLSFTGVVTYIFPSVKFFSVCSECRKSVEAACPDHPSAALNDSMVVSVNLDNGERIVRCVFFGNVIESFFKRSVAELKDLNVKDENFVVNSLRESLLGMVVSVSGRGQVNSFTGNEEIIVNQFNFRVNPVSVAKSLLEKLGL